MNLGSSFDDEKGEFNQLKRNGLAIFVKFGMWTNHIEDRFQVPEVKKVEVESGLYWMRSTLNDIKHFTTSKVPSWNGERFQTYYDLWVMAKKVYKTDTYVKFFVRCI